MENIVQNSSIDVAVLFIIYNRPCPTSLVFSQIRKAKPKRLYIAGDGPKDKEDEEKCRKCREIATQVDWDCEVKICFSDTNLNCGRGPYEAMKWFFTNEEQGIILEDDCLPALSFIRYCKELLDRYKNDNRIMMISGNNYRDVWNNDKDNSYYFSNFTLTWGWATWRRAWEMYDYTLTDFPELMKKKYLENAFMGPLDRMFRLSKLKSTYDRWPNIDWWDYQWQYNLITQSGLCIVPEVNLVRNTGFDCDATHTTNYKDEKRKMSLSEIQFPLRHPRYVMQNVEADKRLLQFFVKSTLKSKISKYFNINL
jgi:hypothetical protein